jgi:Glycine rich protein/PKD-like domain/Secretion system C-terminal sorting domain
LSIGNRKPKLFGLIFERLRFYCSLRLQIINLLHSFPKTQLMKQVYKALALFALCASSLVEAQSVTFNYTGGVQTFTVPACVTSISVNVLGAKAGNNGTYAGGNGGRVQGNIPVTPGEVLNIYVGQLGVSTSQNNPAVYNGGGGVFSYTSGGTSGTGGGASDIRRAPYTNADRLVVAGGGGGGGYVNIGGHGGGLVGQDGVPYISWPNSGGKGGSQSAGGAAGVACCSCPTYTTAGALFQGGNGAGDGAGGGGGGGGYYGGGGSCFAGGGGGSSYTAPSVTGVLHAQGVNAAAGQVTITYIVSGGAPASPASVGGLTTLCESMVTTFTISPVVGATSYTWTVPVGTTINSGQGTTSIFVTIGTNSGNVSVTADNSCGSSLPTNYAITVNLLPVVALGNDITQCGGTVMLDAQNAGSTYLWNDNSTAQTLAVSASGTYVAQVTTAAACVDSDTILVTIHAVPVVSLGTDTTLCGGTVMLDAQNAGSTYLWNDSSMAQMLTASASGAYSVTITDANGCTATDAITVTINTIPTVTYIESQNLVCINWSAIPLTAGSPANGTYAGPGVTGNMFDPTVAGAGTHDVVYTYTDQNGCTSSDTSSITVDLCLNTMETGLANSVSVSPNPNNGVFVLNANAALGDLRIELMDVQGRVVYESKESNVQRGFSKQIETTNLAAGIYYLRLNSGSEQGMLKVVIQE